MRIFFFNCLLWLMGMTILDDDAKLEEDIQARGKCRQVMADNTIVKIQFMNEEDAKLFAKDLQEYLNK
jgi:hypothetical protein